MLLILITEAGNFAVKTIIVKQLGVEYSGVSFLFTDILSVLSLTELGFATATAYALYRPLYERDEQHISSLIGYYRKIYFVIAGVVVALGIGCLPFVDHIVKGVPDIKESIALIFMLYVLKTAASYLFIYKSILLEANQEKNVVSIVCVVTTIIFSGLEIAGLYLFKNYILYLFLAILAVFARNLIVSMIANKKYPYLRTKKPQPLPIAEKKGLRNHVNALTVYKVCNIMQGSVDSIVISMMLGTASVGFLANYRMVMKNVDSFFCQVLEAANPSIGNLAVSENKDKQYSVYRQMTMLAFLIGNFVTVASFALIQPFIVLWLGRSYLLSTPICIALVANLYIIVMSHPYEGFRNANALFVEGKYRPIAMTIINIVLSVVLCKYWGILGVLVATVIARTVTHVWYDPWLVNRRVFHRPFYQYLFVKLVAAMIVAAECFGVYVLTNRIHTGSVLKDLMLYAAICLVVPNAISLCIVCRTKEFKGLLSSLKKVILSIKHKRSE